MLAGPRDLSLKTRRWRLGMDLPEVSPPRAPNPFRLSHSAVETQGGLTALILLKGNRLMRGSRSRKQLWRVRQMTPSVLVPAVGPGRGRRSPGGASVAAEVWVVEWGKEGALEERLGYRLPVQPDRGGDGARNRKLDHTWRDRWRDT